MSQEPRREKDLIAWADLPPVDRVTWPKIVRAPVKGRLVLIVLEVRLTLAWVHWVADRTKPCLGDRCYHHKLNPVPATLRKGYVLCVDPLNNKVVVAELTEDAIQRTPEFYDHEVDLTGSKLELYREGSGFRSPVRSQLTMGYTKVKGRPSYTCRQALERIWFGVKDRERKRWSELVSTDQEMPPQSRLGQVGGEEELEELEDNGGPVS